MDNGHLRALEKRLGWTRWVQSDECLHLYKTSEQTGTYSDIENLRLMVFEILSWAGGTYFVTQPFCSMIEQVRHDIPDEIKMEPNWPLTRNGFVLFDRPFRNSLNPDMVADMNRRGLNAIDAVDALGWASLHNDTVLVFIVLADLEHIPWARVRYGCMPISIFGVPFGTSIQQILGLRKERIAKGLQPALERADERRDCIHLSFTTLYLMAQKIARMVTMKPPRSVRRRMEQQLPAFEPAVRVVSLRREHQVPKLNGQGHPVDWQFKWIVRWHWRNQYLPSTGEHRWTVIDSYVKGPPDKPLKPPSPQIFVAHR